MKTVLVAFVPGNGKTYEFLTTCEYLKTGDRIKSPDYTNYMIVMGIKENENPYTDKGIMKSILHIKTINNIPIKEFGSKIERVIHLNHKEAQKWYKEGGFKRELALRAFTKEELMENNQELLELAFTISEKDKARILAGIRVRAIAKALNGTWTKTSDNIGYVLFKNPSIMVKESYNEWKIGIQESKIPGAIYFKSKEALEKALPLINKDLEELYEK